MKNNCMLSHQLHVRLVMNLKWHQCISQFQLCPLPTPGYWHFFSLDDKFSGQRLLSYQLPCSGDEKRGQMPSPQSTLQLGVSALIGQSSCVTLNILMLIFVSVNVCLCNSANAQPPGSAKVANAPPHGLTRWAQYRVHAASLVARCSLRQV